MLTAGRLIYPFARRFVKADHQNRAHVFTREVDGNEHYTGSAFIYGATIRGINAGIVIPVWGADGTFGKTRRQGGGKVRRIYRCRHLRTYLHIVYIDKYKSAYVLM
jgi:hypothetical protein